MKKDFLVRPSTLKFGRFRDIDAWQRFGVLHSVIGLPACAASDEAAGGVADLGSAPVIWSVRC